MKSLQGMMKKEKLVVILLVGLLLLIAAFPVKEKEKPEILKEETDSADFLKEQENWQMQMEEHLVEVLEQVKGVGKTEVFLTCAGTEKNLVEKDEENTVYTKDAKGNQNPYVAAQEYPQVMGVVIVAEGGDNPVIVRNIQEAVEVLFQVEAHKIKVMKMN